MIGILHTWYVSSWSWYVHRLVAAARVVEGHFNVAGTARNLGKPLFQDYTAQGRAIGFVIRLSRIVLGVTAYAVVAAAITAAYVIWLLLPPAWVAGIVTGPF